MFTTSSRADEGLEVLAHVRQHVALAARQRRRAALARTPRSSRAATRWITAPCARRSRRAISASVRPAVRIAARSTRAAEDLLGRVLPARRCRPAPWSAACRRCPRTGTSSCAEPLPRATLRRGRGRGAPRRWCRTPARGRRRSPRPARRQRRPHGVALAAADSGCRARRSGAPPATSASQPPSMSRSHGQQRRSAASSTACACEASTGPVHDDHRIAVVAHDGAAPGHERLAPRAARSRAPTAPRRSAR